METLFVSADGLEDLDDEVKQRLHAAEDLLLNQQTFVLLSKEEVDKQEMAEDIVYLARQLLIMIDMITDAAEEQMQLKWAPTGGD